MLNTMRTFQKESAGSSEFFRTTETSESTTDAPIYNEDGFFYNARRL